MNEKKLLAKAIRLAAKKHAKQERKDGTSYIYHPMRVAEYLRRAGADTRTQIVAVLHDVLEDTNTSASKIKEFGADIFEAVKLVTRPEGISEDRYVAAILKNPMAARVKMMDKIDNVTDILMLDGYGNERTEKKRAKAARYIKKARKYYYGKFSKALDTVIEEAEKDIQSPVVLRRIEICFEADSMKLYGEEEAEKLAVTEPESEEIESVEVEAEEAEAEEVEAEEAEAEEVEAEEAEAEEVEAEEVEAEEVEAEEAEAEEVEAEEVEAEEVEAEEVEAEEVESAEAESAEVESAEAEAAEAETTEAEAKEPGDEKSDEDDDPADDGLEYL